MSPRKAGARKTRSTKRLSVSKKTIKDLNPRVSRVVGGLVVKKPASIVPTSGMSCRTTC